MFTNAATIASSAFSPASGLAAACAALPSNSTSSSRQASANATAVLRLPGCTMIAQSSPSNAPRAAMYTFPPAASSAGVPITISVPPVSSSSGLSAIPAAHDAVPMMLCPQPCPTPGSASYSARIATRGAPEPAVARKAVAISQMPRSTANPLASRKSQSVAADLCSSNAISGLA